MSDSRDNGDNYGQSECRTQGERKPKTAFEDETLKTDTTLKKKTKKKTGLWNNP